MKRNTPSPRSAAPTVTPNARRKAPRRTTARALPASTSTTRRPPAGSSSAMTSSAWRYGSEERVLATAAEQNFLSLVDLGGEIRRAPLVGMQFLHQGSVRP